LAASATPSLRLPLGADEQDTAALGDGIADRLERAMQQRHGLGESMMWMLLRAPKM